MNKKPKLQKGQHSPSFSSGPSFSKKSSSSEVMLNPNFDPNDPSFGSPVIGQAPSYWQRLGGMRDSTRDVNNQILAQIALLKAAQPYEQQSKDYAAKLDQTARENAAKLEWDYKQKAKAEEDIARANAALSGLTTLKVPASAFPSDTQDKAAIGNYLGIGYGKNADQTGLFDAINQQAANAEILKNKELAAQYQRPLSLSCSSWALKIYLS